MNLEGKVRVRKMEEHEVKEIWLKLQPQIEFILDSQPLECPESFEDLSQISYHRHGHILYDGFKNLLNNHIENTVLPKFLNTPVTGFLEYLIISWLEFEGRGEMIQGVFYYLERVYVPEHRVDNVPTLIRKAFLAKIIQENQTVRHRMVESGLALFKCGGNENDNHVIFEGVFDTLHSLGGGVRDCSVYEQIYERPFLKKLQEYFAEEVKNILEDEKSLGEYVVLTNIFYNRLETLSFEVTKSRAFEIFLEEFIKKPFQFLDGEVIGNVGCDDIQYMQNAGAEFFQKKRGGIILTSNGEMIPFGGIGGNVANVGGEVIQNAGGQVIENVGSKIIQYGGGVIQNFGGGVIQILENKNSSQIVSLYTLFDLVPIFLMKMKDSVKNHLIAKYKNDILTDKFFVQSRLRIKKKIEESLISNEISKIIVDGCGFDYFMNCDQNGPEYTSAYIDRKLKMCQEISDDIIRLLVHLHEKRRFERHYKWCLMKRLFNKSIPVDIERKILQRFNFEFSNVKMEQMLFDFEKSEKINEEFNEHVHKNEIDLKGIELNVRILTLSWPVVPIPPKCTLPVGPRDAFEAFSAFYHNKFTRHRRLTLCPQLGRVHMDVTVTPSSKKSTIHVSTYQMIILDLFNETDEINFEAIKNQTSIPRQDLIQALQALTSKGKEILKMEPGISKLSDIFSVNKNYCGKLTSFWQSDMVGEKRIGNPVRDEGNSRKTEIESAIVKIMKRKNTLSHSDLIVEVRQELEQKRQKFNPQSPVIEKSIQDLIERNYLGRSAEKENIYEYVQ